MALQVCRRLSVQDVRRVVEPVLGEACSMIMVRRGVDVLVSDDDANEYRISDEAATNGKDGMTFAPAPISLPVTMKRS